MRQEFLDELNSCFGNIDFESMEGWCLLSITPLPPQNEIQAVICDIDRGKTCNIINGQVRHSEACTANNHKIKSRVASAINRLRDDTFKIAVYLKEEPPLNQPIAIMLDPLVSYIEYPDHPHINSVLRTEGLKRAGLFLPESICYNINPAKLGSGEEDRILNALGMITIWAFRHQVWLVTRELYGRGQGIWIGEHSAYFDSPASYYGLLDPLGPCRCGRDKLYKDCCLNKDYTAGSSDGSGLSTINIMHWNKFVKLPRDMMINRLRSSYHIS